MPFIINNELSKEKVFHFACTITTYVLHPFHRSEFPSNIISSQPKEYLLAFISLLTTSLLNFSLSESISLLSFQKRFFWLVQYFDWWFYFPSFKF